MPTILVSPTNDVPVIGGAAAPRLTSLNGRTVALLDISKPGGSVFLDRLELLLKGRFGVAEVIRAQKPTYAKPAPPGVLEQLRGVDAAIEALAD